MMKDAMKEALDLLRPGLKEIALWVGLSPETLKKYRTGTMTPSKGTALRMAEAMDEHARHLKNAADKVRDSIR